MKDSESFGLIGIQLPEKYKENFNILSEGPLSGSFFVQGWIQQGFSRGVLGEQPSVSL
jgi:hypothetical protein